MRDATLGTGRRSGRRKGGRLERGAPGRRREGSVRTRRYSDKKREVARDRDRWNDRTEGVFGLGSVLFSVPM